MQQGIVMTFDEFERDWLRRHRGSIPHKRRVSSVSTVFWISFWIIVAFGAAIFSAAHTIPAAEMTLLRDNPSRAEIAKTVFTFMEAMIFGGAALRRKIHWLRWAMWGALVVALAANIGSSVFAVTQNQGGVLIQIVGVLLSILAPLSALAAGEVLHIQLDELKAQRAKAEADYTEALKAMNTKINTAHKRYEKEHDDELPKSVQSIDLNLIKNSQISQRNKPSPKLKKAVEWLRENPQHLETPPRELEEEIGASYGTIFTAQRMLKTGQFSTNGHTPEENV